MAIFTDTAPDAPRGSRRRRTIGWGILAVGIVGVAIAAMLPAPYVIEQPGPVFNTVGDTQYKGTTVPVIAIPSTTKTYPTAGSLDMLTVSITGNRQSPPSWAEIAAAWLDPSQAIVPIDEIYPQGETVDQSNQQNAADMAESQQDAVAAALHSLGYTFPTVLSVATVEKGYPADGVLRVGDVIKTVDGQSFSDVDSLRAAVAANGTATPATIVFTRDGVMHTAMITPVMSSAATPAPILGIAVGTSYTFPVPIKIQLQDVGGPSAGMMFALGIIDKLTPGELNGGKRVAGTGTIDSAGTVGAIGGIRQKMYGAARAGARYFLAPRSNCDEVVGHIPAGLHVYSVATLDDSLTALKAISSGKGLASLSSCAAGS